jgi:NADH-quinone oxidoreductase subunit M
MGWAYMMAVLAASGVILTAGYILWLIRRVYLGKEREAYAGFADADARETLILVPMAVLCIALGVLPMQTVFRFANGTLNLVVRHVTAMIS